MKVYKHSVGDVLNALVETSSKNKKISFRKMALTAGLNPAVDFRGASLRELDLRDEDLTGFDFSGADLTGSDFRRANINKVRFDNANLNGVIGVDLEVKISDIDIIDKAAATQIVKRSIVAGIVPDLLMAENITQLRFGKTGISDISLITNVKNLEYISLTGTNVKNIDSISELKKLRVVNIDNTKIDNLLPLSNCEKLRYLSANDTPLQSLDGIQHCKLMANLSLKNTSINHIEEVKSLNLLTNLAVGGGNLSNARAIERCPILHVVTINSPIMTDLPDFSHLKYLVSLKVSSASREFPKIDGLARLSSIFVSSRKCDYIPDFSSLTNLKSISLDMNKDFIFDKIILGNSIQSLSLYNFGIKNISNIEGANNIKNLTLRFSELIDLSFLKDMQNIQSLTLSQIRGVVDLSTFPVCENLTYLSLKGDSYEGISSLRRLPNLKSISTNSIKHVDEIRNSGLDVDIYLDGVGPVTYVDESGTKHIKFVVSKHELE